MLLAVDFYEDLVDEEGVSISPMLPLQAAGINGIELDTPEPDRLANDNATALS